MGAVLVWLSTAQVGGRCRYLLVSGTQLNKQQLTIARDHCNKLLFSVEFRILIDSSYLIGTPAASILLHIYSSQNASRGKTPNILLISFSIESFLQECFCKCTMSHLNIETKTKVTG